MRSGDGDDSQLLEMVNPALGSLAKGVSIPLPYDVSCNVESMLRLLGNILLGRLA